jgi:hypothetical protein
MRHAAGARWLIFILTAVTAGVAVAVWPADAGAASGFGGTVTYTGKFGPISRTRTICICAFADPELTDIVGCIEVDSSPGHYDAFAPSMRTYYVLTFVDFNLDVALEPGEPYQIYNGKSTPPGDPVVTGLTETAVDITFGDENLAPFPTASPPPSTPTPTSTGLPATATPTAIPCVGDCSHDDHVTVDELITLVNIALGIAPPGDCLGGDVNHDQQVTIDEILTAVSYALHGCSPGAPS